MVKILWQPEANYMQDGLLHDAQSIAGAILSDSSMRMAQVGTWRPLLASTKSPSFTISDTTRASVEGLRTGSTLNGRQITSALKVIGVDTLIGATVSGAVITVSTPDVTIEGWDLSGYKLRVTSSGCHIINNHWVEPEVPPSTSHYPIEVAYTASNTIIEYNTIESPYGYGGPSTYINMQTSGVGAATIGAVNTVIRFNRLLNCNSDLYKLAGNGTVVYRNYNGPPINYPVGTVAYDASASYSQGDYVLVGPILHRSDTNGNSGNQPPVSKANSWVSTTTYGANASVRYDGRTFISIAASNLGNTPPTSAISDSFWAYNQWETLDPHCDAITVTSSDGAGISITENLFDWDVTRSPNSIGVTQIIRVTRNTGTSVMMGPVEFSDNVSTGVFAGYYPISIGVIRQFFTTVTYALGGLCAIGSNWYKSLQSGNLNHPPETSPEWWELTSEIFAPGPFVFADNFLGAGLNGAYIYPDSYGFVDTWGNNLDISTGALISGPPIRP